MPGAAETLRLDLSRSFFVGDGWRDIEAGYRAGCTTLLVGVQSGRLPQTRADFLAADVCEAASIILRSIEEAPPHATVR